MRCAPPIARPGASWRERVPMQPLEAQIADVIAEHPEYQPLLQSDATLCGGIFRATAPPNPFLHMGLHLALREQLSTDRPRGIAAIHRHLAAGLQSDARGRASHDRGAGQRPVGRAARRHMTPRRRCISSGCAACERARASPPCTLPLESARGSMLGARLAVAGSAIVAGCWCCWRCSAQLPGTRSPALAPTRWRPTGAPCGHRLARSSAKGLRRGR